MTINLNNPTQLAAKLYGPSAGHVSQQLALQAESVASYLLPNGRRIKNEWVAGDAYGADGTSLKLHLSGEHAGHWHDFATEEKGDLLDLWALSRGIDLSAAIKQARDYLGHGLSVNNKPVRKQSSPAMNHAQPQEKLRTVHTWVYPEKDGITGQAIRLENGTGDKKVLPYFSRDGKAGIEPGFTPPLYGQADKRYVFIAEGEKCVDALLQMGLAAVTSQGGCKAAGKADWSALDDTATVYLLADNDTAGTEYMREVAQLLEASKPGREIKQVMLPDLPAKGDIVDWVQTRLPDWDGYAKDARIARLKDQLRECVQAAPPVEAAPQPEPGEPWPVVEELPSLMLPVEPFDYALLPESLRPYVEYCARNINCPPDFIATAALVAAATLIGRKVCIRPKRNEPWSVVVNLWGANVGVSAQGKSPGQEKGLHVLRQLDEEAWKAFEEDSQANAALAHQREAEKTALKQNLAQHYRKKKKSGDDFDVASTSRRMAELEAEGSKLRPKRYWTSDTTTEKLVELLNENPNGLLLVRDELMGWLKSLERKGREGDRPFYLECHSGKGKSYTDRIGRGFIRCENMCLSIHGCITPGPLREYVTEATGRGAGADGMLQRFQLMVWPDLNANWTYRDDPLDKTTVALAESMFRRLDRLTPEAVGATIPENDLPFLHFTEEAQEVFIEWSTDLRLNKLTADEHEAFQSHLGKYESLMASLALILHLADGNTGPVGMKAALKACAWCDYLESHARRVYAPLVFPELAVATMLTHRIRSGQVPHGMSVRDVLRKGWSGMNEKGKAIKAIELLEEYGWLKLAEEETKGRKTALLQLHPELRKTNFGASVEEEVGE